MARDIPMSMNSVSYTHLMVKPRLYNDEDTTKKAAIWTLKKVLIDALKLLHPYMPFITEEIFCNIQDEEESIMISAWPVYSEAFNFAEDENAIETIKQAVRNIRNVRAEMNVAPSRKAKAVSYTHLGLEGGFGSELLKVALEQHS